MWATSMGRQRLAKNRGLPPNLYLNSAGYFYFVNPRSKETKGLGREKARACGEARAANAALAEMKPSSLADWVRGKKDYTLAEWLPIYEELWLADEKRAVNTLRAFKLYRGKIERWGCAWMGLSQIETQHVAEFVRDCQAESGPAAAMQLRARLSDLFRWAETEGLIKQGANPVTATYAPPRKVKRSRLTLEQFFAIREVAPAWLQRAMNLALMTAQRRGDVARLKFTDYRDGSLFIVQGKGQGAVRLQQDGAIRLDADGMTIHDAVQACRDSVVSRFLIHHVRHQGRAKPGNAISENTITDAFASARDAAKVGASDPDRTPPSFHEIRSLAQRLYRKEYGAEFAQAMLGHKNAQMTAKYDDLRGSGWQVVAAVN